MTRPNFDISALIPYIPILLHQASGRLSHAQIASGHGAIEFVEAPGAGKLLLFNTGLVIANLPDGFYGNVDSYTHTAGLTVGNSEIAFGGWTTELLTDAVSGASKICQLGPALLPDGNDPPNVLITSSVALDGAINQPMTFYFSNTLGAITGGGSNNSMTAYVSYFIFNTVTGLYE
jgi:hypothetical protein